jgi:hypothetical protein
MILVTASVIPNFLSLYGRSSFIENYEYEAAQWIKENSSQNTLLLSDQATMLLFSSLCDKYTLVHLTQNYPEGYPIDVQLLSFIYNLFLTTDPLKVYTSLMEIKALPIQTEEYYQSFQPIKNPDFLIIISPRTSLWADWGGKTVIWYPNGNVYNNKPANLSIRQDYLSKFLDSKFFNLVYQEEGKIYIFKPLWSEIVQSKDYPGQVGENSDAAALLYNFNEMSGTTLHDTSGNLNDGKIIGSTWVNSGNRTALYFNGVDDYVVVPNQKSLNITEEITLEAWIKPETMTDVRWYEILCKGSNYVYHLFYNNDPQKTLDMGVKIGGTNYFLEEPFVPDGLWHHLVGTYKSGDFRLYLDGILVKSKSSVQGDIDSNAESLTIGSLLKGNVSACNWHGEIGEIRIYNRVLAQDEITAHFESNYQKFYNLRSATVREDTPGYMIEIPLQTLNSEETRIKLNVKVSDTSPNMTAFRCEILDETTGNLIYEQNVTASQFSIAGDYQFISTGIILLPNQTDVYKFRVFFSCNVDVTFKEIYIK